MPKPTKSTTSKKYTENDFVRELVQADKHALQEQRAQRANQAAIKQEKTRRMTELNRQYNSLSDPTLNAGARAGKEAAYYRDMNQYGADFNDRAAYNVGYAGYQDAASRVRPAYEVERAELEKASNRYRAMTAHEDFQGPVEKAGAQVGLAGWQLRQNAGFYEQMARDAEKIGSRELWDKASSGYSKAVSDYISAVMDEQAKADQAYKDWTDELHETNRGAYFGETLTEDQVAGQLRMLERQRADLDQQRAAAYEAWASDSTSATGEEHQAKEDEYNRIVAQLQHVEDEIATYKGAKTYQDRNKYAALRAQYTSDGHIAPEMAGKVRLGMDRYKQDKDATLASEKEKSDKEFRNGSMSDVLSRRNRTDKGLLASAGWDFTIDVAKHLDYEDEAIFYALYADNPEEAIKWAKMAKEAQDEAWQADISEWAGQNTGTRLAAFAGGTLANWGSGVANFFSPYSEDVLDMNRFGKALLSGGAHGLTEKGLFNTGLMAGTIDENTPIVGYVLGGKGLGDLYQLGSSILESTATAYAAAHTGDLSGVVSALGTIIMGSSASVSDYDECIKRGLTERQALFHALAAGINEAAFEYISMDKLVNPNYGASALKQWFQQAGIEASEEFCTTIANTLADGYLARRDGYDTSVEQRAKELIAMGMGHEEAVGKAKNEWMADLINDAIGGYISGGFSQGVNAVTGYAMSKFGDVADRIQYESDMTKALEQQGAMTNANEAQALQSFAAANDIAFDEAAAQGVESRQPGVSEDLEGTTLAKQAEQAAQTKQTRRERRQEQKSNRSLGTVQEQVVSKLAENIRQSGLNNAQRVYEEQVAQHGEGISRSVQAAVARVAAEQFGAVTTDNMAKANAAYKAALEGATSQPVREAIKQGYDMAVEDAAYSGSKAAQSRYQQDKLTGWGKGGALNLNAEIATKDGKTEQVQIVDLGNEKGKVKLSNGQTVSVKSLQGLDADVADVIQQADRFDLGTARSLMWKDYQLDAAAGKVTDGVRWIMSYALAFDQGRRGIKTLQEAQAMSILDKDVVRRAYQQGAEVTEEWRRNQLKANEKARAEAPEGVTGKKGILDTSAVSEETMKNLSADKKQALKTIEMLANALGVDFRIVTQTVDEKGNIRGWQGKFNLGENTIEIDINAGINNIYKDLHTGILAVTGHELTHWMQENAPTEYLAYKKAVLSAIENGRNGHTTLERLIDQVIKDNKQNGLELTRSQAEDEVVADASMKRLGDQEFWDTVSGNLGEQRQGVVAKLKEFFSKFFAKIREIIGKTSHMAEAAQLVDQAEKAVQDTLRKLYAEGIGAAMRGTSGQTVTEAEQVAAEKGGAVIDVKSESAAPTDLELHSERTWSESRFVQDWANAAKALAKALNCSVKNATKYIDDINSVAATIAGDRARLDYLSSPGRSAFKSNAEYGGSIDFSTLCKKRRLLTGTFTAIQKALANTVLTAEDVLKIRQMMLDKGLEVSCGLCYVEGSRAKMGEYNKTFLDLYQKYFPDRWQPTMADVNTADGIEQVRIDHPECYEQFEYFYNHYGTLRDGDKAIFSSQAKPKEYQLRTEYKGEIITQFDDSTDVETKNRNGGMRLQSFSDFEIVHLIDCMQVIMDMSEVGLAGQAYTKVPEFAEALGKTGLKINLSLIAKGVDENGGIIYNDTEGMNHNTAFDIRSRFSDNVGTILVVYDDAQLKAAMADEMVDFIIPFHRSQWKKSQYKAMGLPTTTKDYTYQQNEKWLNPKAHTHEAKTGPKRQVPTKCTNYMPNEYWNTDLTGKQNAEAYLAMCAKDGKRPKFYKLLQNNGDGSYSLQPDGSTDGYWKLLVDFKMYNNEGKGAPQKPVQPVFNMTSEDPNAVTVESMLRDYTGGHQNFPVAQGIVDDFVAQYKAKHPGRQYSSRATDEQYNSKEAETIHDGVESAADSVKFSLRTDPAPKKTQDVYKLMRLGKDGNLYPLFIDSANGIEVGKWYDADSPDFTFLQKMPEGVFLVDTDTQTYQTLEEYQREHGDTRKRKLPPREWVDEATLTGKRWMTIKPSDEGVKRYGGETRRYYNVGINGSGSVSTFALRPGWHAGSLPTMRQIGKGANKNLRDDSFVWVKGRVPADIDYQQEAERNIDKDIPTHIPHEGYYLKATNANATASQADRVGWYVAGSFIADRIIGDAEARSVIDQWNQAHPNDEPVDYDYDRESGKVFNADTMSLEDTVRYSLRDYSDKSDYEILREADPMTAATTEEQRKNLEMVQKRIDKVRSQQYELNSLRKKIEAATGDKRAALEEKAKTLQGRISGNVREIDKSLNTAAMQNLLKAQRAATRERVQAQYRERRTEADLRRRIKNLRTELANRIAKPTDRVYVPAELAQPLIDVLDALDASPREGTKAAAKYATVSKSLRELARAYGQLSLEKQNEIPWAYKVEYQEEIADAISDLEKATQGRNLRDLSAEELQQVYDTVKLIRDTMRDATKLLNSEYYKDIYEAITDLVAQQTGMTPLADVGKHEAAVRSKVMKGMSPMRAVEYMSGMDRDAALYRFVQAVEQGTVHKDAWIMGYNKLLQDLKTGKNELTYRNAMTKLLDFGATDKKTGRTVRMTKMQALQLLMTWQREQANDKLSHLEKGGAVIRDALKIQEGKAKEATSHTISVTPELIARINSSLTTWDKQLMKVVRQYLKEEAKATNEVLYKLKRQALPTEENYIPYIVDKSYLEAKLEGNDVYNLFVKSFGSTKPLQKMAPQPLIIDGLDSMMTRHVKDAANYIGLAIPIRDFSKVFNGRLSSEDGGVYTSVQKTIDDNFGESGLHLLKQSLIDVQGGSNAAAWQSNMAEYLNKLQGAFIRTALLANFSVTIKQAASYIAAESVLSHKALVEGNRPLFAKGDSSKSPSLIAHLFFFPQGATAQRLFNEIDEYTSMHYVRRQGMSHYELAEQAQRAGKLKRFTGNIGARMEQSTIGHGARRAISSADPLQWIQKMDVATTAALWVACKEQARLDGKKVGSQEYWTRTTELYEQCLRETQPMYDSLHRTANQKDKTGILQFLFPFRTVPIQNHGQLAMAYEGLKASKDKSKAEQNAARTHFAKTVWAQTESAFIFSLMTFIAAMAKRKTKKYRDEDEEFNFGSFIKGFGLDMASTLFSVGVPMAGSEIWSWGDRAVNKLTGKGGYTYDAFSVGLVDMMNDLVSASDKIFSDIGKAWRGDDVTLKDVTDHGLNLLLKAAKLAGIPADTVKTYWQGIKGNVEDIANGRVPALNDESWERSAAVNAERYVKALEAGDTEKVDLVEAEMLQDYADAGKNEDEAAKALKSKLTSTVKEKYESGKLEGQDAVDLLVETGFYDENDAWKKVKEWEVKDEEGYSYSQYDEVYEAMDKNGDISKIVKDLEDHGVDPDSIKSAAKGHLIDRYMDGQITDTQIKNQLSRYCGIVGDDAKNLVRWLDLRKAKPGLEVTQAQCNSWYDGSSKSRENNHESAKAAGMSIEAYLQAKAALENVKDSNGNGTGEDEYIAALKKLDILARQKAALYYEKYKGTTKYSVKWY